MTACIDSPKRAHRSRSAARIRRRLCPAPHITACGASPSVPLSGLGPISRCKPSPPPDRHARTGIGRAACTARPVSSTWPIHIGRISVRDGALWAGREGLLFPECWPVEAFGCLPARLWQCPGVVGWGRQDAWFVHYRKREENQRVVRGTGRMCRRPSLLPGGRTRPINPSPRDRTAVPRTVPGCPSSPPASPATPAPAVPGHRAPERG